MPQSTEPSPASPSLPDQLTQLQVELERANFAKEHAQNAAKEWATELDSMRDRNTVLQKALQDAEDARHALAARLHQSEHEREKLEVYRGQDKRMIEGLKLQLEVAQASSGEPMKNNHKPVALKLAAEDEEEKEAKQGHSSHHHHPHPSLFYHLTFVTSPNTISKHKKP
jgi:septal ring factor EnvC (AmiA/AmiB activator)